MALGAQVCWSCHSIFHTTDACPNAEKTKTMRDDRIKEGDVVCLKSGGPKLTVVSVEDGRTNSGPIGTCTVAWFAEGGDYREAYGLSLDALTKAEKL